MNQVKQCRVCGDQATGYHYQALSCESCKAFFYRNASKHEKAKCKNEDSCTINKFNRMCCMKCRLDKCVAIGMTKETKEDEQNGNSCKILKVYLGANNQLDMNILKNIMFINNNHNKVQHNEEIEFTEKWFDKKKYTIDLNLLEMQKISDVQKAINVGTDERLIPNIRKAVDFIDALGSPELYVKMIVEFCKKIYAFNQLSERDQFVVFKPFCFDFLLIRFCYMYDQVNDAYVILGDELGNEGIFFKYEIFYTDQNRNIFEFNKKFTIAMQNEMENDQTIRDLLTAQQLFKPQNNVSCPEFLRYYYIFYSRLLLRYLEQKYNNLRIAKNKFGTLMNFVDNFEVVKTNEAIMFRECGKDELPHVFVEMYDLE